MAIDTITSMAWLVVVVVLVVVFEVAAELPASDGFGGLQLESWLKQRFTVPYVPASELMFEKSEVELYVKKNVFIPIDMALSFVSAAFLAIGLLNSAIIPVD